MYGDRASDEEANSPRRRPAATGGETSDGSGKAPSPSHSLKALVKKLPEGWAELRRAMYALRVCDLRLCLLGFVYAFLFLRETDNAVQRSASFFFPWYFFRG